MTDLRDAARQALEALESRGATREMHYHIITALRAALEQPCTYRCEAWPECGCAALEQPEQCACGDRPKDQCPGEWEPGCDLGNNSKYARRVPLEHSEQATVKESLPVGQEEPEGGWQSATSPEQLEQEPEAFMYVGIKNDGTTHGPHLVWRPEHMDAMSAEKGVVASPLYTHPPRREWRGLTEEELRRLWRESTFRGNGGQIDWFTEGARVAEAALRSKNYD